MNYKKILLIVCIPLGLRADIVIEQTNQASKPYDQWNFELSNKSSKPINISLYRAYGEKDEHKKFLTGKEYSITPKGKWRISGINNKRFDVVLIIKYQKNKHEKELKFRFPAQRKLKQIFVKFENDLIVPQLGKAAGVARETESGIPITNNIAETEIIGNDKELIIDRISDNLFS